MPSTKNYTTNDITWDDTTNDSCCGLLFKLIFKENYAFFYTARERSFSFLSTLVHCRKTFVTLSQTGPPARVKALISLDNKMSLWPYLSE